MNEYSGDWFRFFLDTIPAAQTAREVAFLTGQLPLPHYARVLDVCCGPGRHALPLAALGYDVTGIDRDKDAIATARRAHAPRTRFHAMGALELDRLARDHDAVLCLWASFGYLDDAANRTLFALMAGRLRPGGRIVLDIYNRDFFATRCGERRFERAGRPVTERTRLDGDRLTVELVFGEPPRTERFGWQLFTPDEVHGLARRADLSVVGACTDFDDAVPPSPERPRMQIVLGKTA